MSKEQDKPWVDKQGRPITFKDCKDAIHSAISSMSKALAENPVIDGSDVIYLTYKHDIDVLEVLREKFDLMDKQTRKVQRKTVKKRGTQKKIIH